MTFILADIHNPIAGDRVFSAILVFSRYPLNNKSIESIDIYGFSERS
jgi:hypothetical protein